MRSSSLVDGELVWYLERGGRSLLSFNADPEMLGAPRARLPSSSAAAGSADF